MFRIGRQDRLQVIRIKPAQFNQSLEWQFAVPMTVSHVRLILQCTHKETAAVP